MFLMYPLFYGILCSSSPVPHTPRPNQQHHPSASSEFVCKDDLPTVGDKIFVFAKNLTKADTKLYNCQLTVVDNDKTAYITVPQFHSSDTTKGTHTVMLIIITGVVAFIAIFLIVYYCFFLETLSCEAITQQFMTKNGAKGSSGREANRQI